jgi:type II secretory pathway component HofQ
MLRLKYSGPLLVAASLLVAALCMFCTLAVSVAAARPPWASAAQDVTGQNQPPLDPELQRKQEKARAEQRDKKLKQDASELLKLAQQLKAAVDKTNEHVLSLEVVDKADQIGKLAKKIKESMRDAR